MQQAEAFHAESTALHDLLQNTQLAHYAEPTQFKDWSINTVLQHLHF